jgi:drug/metabolite transporter (DMT)-like permease
MSDPLRAILLMLLYSALMSCAEGVAKALGDDYSIVQIVWSRYALVFPVLSVFCWRRLHDLLGDGPTLAQIARGACPVIAGFFIVEAYRHMPVANAVSVMFSAPLMVALLAIPFLGERVGPVRWLAVLVGFAGVLLVVRPAPSMDPAVLLPLVTALLFAIYQIMTRTLSRRVSALSMVYFLALVGFFVPLAGVPFVWKTPDGVDWLLFAAEAACYGLGHTCITLAIVRGEASMLAPFGYVQVPGTMIFGLLAFGEFPGPVALAGMTLIIGSGLLVWLRERRRKRVPAGGSGGVSVPR